MSTNAALSGFNVTDRSQMAAYPKEYNFRSIVFWQITNSITNLLDKYTFGEIEPWFKSIKDMSDESIEKASAYARIVASMASNYARQLEDQLRRDRTPNHTKEGRLEWDRLWKIRTIAIALSHMADRQFDDWSLAFYVAALTKLDSIDDGYVQVRAKYYQILDAIEQTSDVNEDEPSDAAQFETQHPRQTEFAEAGSGS